MKKKSYSESVLVWSQFSPILIPLFEKSRKNKGVHKFVLENPSNIFVYGIFFLNLEGISWHFWKSPSHFHNKIQKGVRNKFFQENQCMTQNHEQLLRHSNESPKNKLMKWKLFTDRKKESCIKLLWIKNSISRFVRKSKAREIF
jgi:hypothetical protein